MRPQHDKPAETAEVTPIPADCKGGKRFFGTVTARTGMTLRLLDQMDGGQGVVCPGILG
jgi:hypothetical protein